MEIMTAAGEKINFLKKNLLEIFFPDQCLGCGRADLLLCNECFSKIYINKEFICPICSAPSFAGNLCFECRDKYFIDGVYIAGNYQDKLLKESIKIFKYHYVVRLAEPLSKILIICLEKALKTYKKNFDLIAPTPLHQIRYYQRGFNQSELLAKKLSDFFKISYQPDLLIKTKNSAPQSQLDLQERKNNVSGKFKIKEGFSLKNKNVLLVDDVITTASTLNECAKMLKKSGASNVWGLVLAKN